MSPVYFITGASRGLGLEFAKQILEKEKDSFVIATARDPSAAKGLQALVAANPGRIHALKMDVTSEGSVKAAVNEVESLNLVKNGVDVLINNAGVALGTKADGTFKTALTGSVEDLAIEFTTNVVGVILTTQHLIPLLRKGTQKKILTIGSAAGSLGGYFADLPWVATYSTSKSAVHMWTRKVAAELKDEGFTVIIAHPGYVKTDMAGGPDGPADIYPDEAVEKTLAVFNSKTPEDTGKLFSYTGETLPW
ncbi:NAD(P)-binding protein [Meredithblackwellia eburnea MCA 4105]